MVNKIYHLGDGKYSIRSMYDNRYGLAKTIDGDIGHEYLAVSGNFEYDSSVTIPPTGVARGD